jgi:hypothetical protein
MHGGKTPRGFALPQTKTGLHSKDLPTRLAVRYEAALADPELLSLRSQVAVLDAREGELYAGLDRGEAGAIWQALGVAVAELEEARATNSTKKMAVALASITSLVRQGASDAQKWVELYEVIGLRRSVAESERKRLTDMEQMFTAKQGLLLAAALVAAVKRAVDEHVDDDKLRAVVIEATRANVAQVTAAGEG